MEINTNLKTVIESLLIVSDEPLSVKKICQITDRSPAEVKKCLNQLADELQAENRGFQLRQVSGGYRFFSHPANAAYVEKLVQSWDKRRLTQAALESLAIIAYKQPVTKATVNAIRGVNSETAIASLLAKGLVKEVGREKSPGSPVLYGTTDLFLEKFGLTSLTDLPPLTEFEQMSEEQEAGQPAKVEVEVEERAFDLNFQPED